MSVPLVPSSAQNESPFGTRLRRLGLLRRGEQFVRRNWPAVVVLIAVGPIAAVVALDLVFDVSFDETCAPPHAVSCGLAQNALITLAAAAVAFYLLLGRAHLRALRAYQTTVRDDPAALLPNTPADLEATRKIRGTACRALAYDICSSAAAPLVVVEGRDGSGKSPFMAELASALAKRGRLPVVVSMRGERDIDIEGLARASFVRAIDRHVKSDSIADSIWRRVRKTHSLVVLLQAVDESPALALSNRKMLDRLETAIDDLRAQHIPVVLSLCGPLDLKQGPTLREQLDRLEDLEARRYVAYRLQTSVNGSAVHSEPWDDHAGITLPPDVEQALRSLVDPIEGSQAHPFYLDELVEVHTRGGGLTQLPEQRDLQRAYLLEQYVRGLEGGWIREGELATAAPRDDRDLMRRRAAIAAVTKLADTAAVDHVWITGRDIEDWGSAHEDALTLGLIQRAAGGVQFANTAVRAYFTSRALAEPRRLIVACTAAPAGDATGLTRGRRQALMSLLAWCIHRRDGSAARVRYILALLLASSPDPAVRPAILATVARAAAACGLEDVGNAVAEEARRMTADAPISERVQLVRALGRLGTPIAYRSLWHFATQREHPVQWTAAKILANAGRPAYEANVFAFDAILRRAEDAPVRDLSERASDVGFALGSIAWVLPSLQDGSPAAKRQFKELRRLCLHKDMSPLRGELSFAQGIKLALVLDDKRSDIAALARDLLLGKRRLRFWHARLVLVQALAIYARAVPDSDGEDVRRALHDVAQIERHPLVRRGCEQAITAATRDEAGKLPVDPWSYLWRHEGEVARSANHGRDDRAGLAGPVILLSTMLYEQRAKGDRRVDDLAQRDDLPHCLCGREVHPSLDGRCDCDFGLCPAGPPEVMASRRIRLSPGFCRTQARLEPPPWVPRTPAIHQLRTRRLRMFWRQREQEAERAARRERGVSATS